MHISSEKLLHFLSLMSISIHSLDVKIINFKRCMYRIYVRSSRHDQPLLHLVLLKSRCQFLPNMNPQNYQKFMNIVITI